MEFEANSIGPPERVVLRKICLTDSQFETGKGPSTSR